MYQLDSWYTVLFEILLVGFSFYNSFRMTKWWDIVSKGTAIGVNGAQRVPSVADHFGIQTEKSEKKQKSAVRSYAKRHLKSPNTFEMGDGLKVQ